MTKSQEYIVKLFSDALIFEKEVLHVNSDEDRKEVMNLMSQEMCTDSKITSQISFLKMKTINNMSFEGATISLVEIFVSELISLLRERRYSHSEIETIKKNKNYLKFMYHLAQTYMRRFNAILYKEVVNTFFELIGVADKPEKIQPLVLEVINGNKTRKSLLEQHGGGQILYKAEQAWMRVRQAKDDKNRKAKVFQIETVRLVRRVDKIKLHISAIVASKALSISDIKKISPEILLDMFTDDTDMHLQVKKIMFSYLTSSELLGILISLAQTSRNMAEDAKEKDEFSKIADFFKKCKNKNTKKSVEEDFDDLKEELKLKSARYREQRLKLQSLRERPLDSFDTTLKKVKEAMVYNLQHL